MLQDYKINVIERRPTVRTYNWGILGTGNIAHKFAEALLTLDNARILGVGSRSIDTASSFAKDFGIKKVYDSYRELAADPEIDIIYIATPHQLHYENMKLCIMNGKAILCEKPFAVNAKDAKEIQQLALQKNIFVMEAFKTKFLPVMKKVKELIDNKEIGEIKMLKADFGFDGGFNENKRLLNPKLAGGSLLDVGIYPLTLATMIFGNKPRTVHSIPHIGITGVDEQAVIIMGFEEGKLAQLSCAVTTDIKNQAHIIGSKGFIRIPNFSAATIAEFCVNGMPEQIIDLPHKCNGFEFEAMEVMECLSEGKTHSDINPLSDTIAILEIMDRLRKEWGLKYPFEN